MGEGNEAGGGQKQETSTEREPCQPPRNALARSHHPRGQPWVSLEVHSLFYTPRVLRTQGCLGAFAKRLAKSPSRAGLIVPGTALGYAILLEEGMHGC